MTSTITTTVVMPWMHALVPDVRLILFLERRALRLSG